MDSEQLQGFDGIAASRAKAFGLRTITGAEGRPRRLGKGAQGLRRRWREVVEDDAGGTYRAVYTVKFTEAVFVLHCFQKKSKRGIATPKDDMDIFALG